MSFWDNVRKLTQPYAEDGYDDYDDEDSADGYEEDQGQDYNRAPAEDTQEERPDPFASLDARPTPVSSASTASSTASSFGGVTTMSSSRQQVVVMQPSKFTDSVNAANELRAKKAVVINMENMDKAMARRIVDFLSGCIYAIDGQVTKVAQSTYLFTPHNMEVSGDALKNLQSEVESYV